MKPLGKREIAKLCDQSLEERFPVTVNLLLTMRCNFSCSHCMYRSGPTQPAAYMSESDLEEIVGFCRLLEEHGQQVELNIVGGEPTYNLGEFARCMRQLDYQDGIENFGVEMTTNGWWLRSLHTCKRFALALWRTSFEETIRIRISNSVFHDYWRTERETAALLAMKAGSDSLLEHLWENFQLPDSDIDGCEFDRHYGSATRWLVDKLNDETLFVDSKLTQTGVIPVGRARDLHIDSGKNGGCHWKHDITFTFMPGAVLHDPCCNGGRVALGHARDGMQLWARRVLFMRALHAAYPDKAPRCYNCPTFGAGWTGVQMTKHQSGIQSWKPNYQPQEQYE